MPGQSEFSPIGCHGTAPPLRNHGHPFCRSRISGAWPAAFAFHSRVPRTASRRCCRVWARASAGGSFSAWGSSCACAGGLIACFAVLSAQMRQPAQVVAVDPVAVDPLSAADKAFNARYYPLVDCPRFRFATLRQRMASWHGYMSLPYLYPTPDDLPTGDPSPKTPLYPGTPAVTPARHSRGALEVR
jgi:hypothetical protein